LAALPARLRTTLNGDTRVRLTYIVFDVLELDGSRTMHLPYVEQRWLLEDLQVQGPRWRTSPSFDDGEAVFVVACERGLEGVVAKRLRASYRPGERGWLKIKNRAHFLCECADTSCTKVVLLSLEEYAEVREHPARFLTLPDHEEPETEVVIDEERRYQIVQKRGEAAAVARRLAAGD
jgi:hypothetical protein